MVPLKTYDFKAFRLKVFKPRPCPNRGGLLNFRCKTSEFTKPLGSYEFCGFSFRKSQERASKFGSILGHDWGLINNCSAIAGGAPNWTGRNLNNSYLARV